MVPFFAIVLDYEIRSHFRIEIEDLQNLAIRERERYKESTQLMSDGISAIPMLPVNDAVRNFSI